MNTRVLTLTMLMNQISLLGSVVVFSIAISACQEARCPNEVPLSDREVVMNRFLTAYNSNNADLLLTLVHPELVAKLRESPLAPFASMQNEHGRLIEITVEEFSTNTGIYNVFFKYEKTGTQKG